MEEKKNLEVLTREVSHLLYDSKNLLEILSEIIDGNRKEDFLVNSVIKNINNAFDTIENCRMMISFPD